MLKRVKQGLLGTARAIGALRGVADSSWRRNRLLILCYHSASLEQEHIWRPALYFQPDALEQRLRQIEAMRCAVLHWLRRWRGCKAERYPTGPWY